MAAQTKRAQKPSVADCSRPIISVDDLAAQLFLKLFMDHGRTPEYLAGRAYEAAEAFVSVAQSR